MARAQFADVIVHAQSDGSLNTYAGVTIDVFLRGTSTRPSLFADVTGATPVSNPFTTPTTGGIEFCAEEGIEYDIKIHDNSSRVADKTLRWSPARMPKVGDMRLAAHSESDTPDGQWVVSDGRALSRASFATLFSTIGTIHGNGDGSTTFNIPDMRGRVPFGIGAGPGLSTWNPGDKAGAETLSVAQLPPHTHGYTDPGHRHRLNTADAAVGSGAATARIATYGTPNVFTDQPAGSWSGGALVENSLTGISIANTGSGALFWPPGTAVKYLIKVK
jgi:microcystin-dependent protein